VRKVSSDYSVKSNGSQRDTENSSEFDFVEQVHFFLLVQNWYCKWMRDFIETGRQKIFKLGNKNER
jgi:hypothetical protein